MAEQTTLTVARRTVLGKKVKQLRRQGRVPANIFGRDGASLPVEVDAHTLDQFLRHHPATRVITMPIEGQDGPPETVLVRHVQHHPYTSRILHVDFFHVAMDEKVTARIPLHFVEEAPAVKNLDGVLLHILDTIEVEAFPADLPEALTVSLAGLTELDSAIHVRDILVPPRVQVLDDPEEMVVKVSVPRAVLAEEAEEAAPAEAAPAGAPPPEAETEA
jgi:large subunit ribosomal protein L25